MSERSLGADRDWLLRFAQREQAPALAALFTIEAEINDSLRADLSHEIAHARLGWWQEELGRLADASPRHPATRALATHARGSSTSPPDLRALIDHAEVTLAAVAFLSRAELDEHLGHWAISVFRAATGSDAPEAERLAASAGPPVRELELLSDFSRHARAGRIYTPLGDPPQDHAPWSTVPLPPEQHATLATRRAELVTALRKAAAQLPAKLRPSLRTPLLWMTFAVDRATRSPTDFAIGRAEEHDTRRLEPWRRTMLAWRAALAISRERLPNPLIG